MIAPSQTDNSFASDFLVGMTSSFNSCFPLSWWSHQFCELVFWVCTLSLSLPSGVQRDLKLKRAIMQEKNLMKHLLTDTAITSTWIENAYISTEVAPPFYSRKGFFSKSLFSFFMSVFAAVPESQSTNILCSYLMHFGQQALLEELKRKVIQNMPFIYSNDLSILISQILLLK